MGQATQPRKSHQARFSEQLFADLAGQKKLQRILRVPDELRKRKTEKSLPQQGILRKAFATKHPK